MGKTLTGEDWTLVHGDCRVAFLSRAPGSVHAVVTSPPYWGGVRDYGIGPSKWGDGWDGCFGNEPTVEGYVAHTLEVFGALGHALRDDGVIWWNIGDCYCTGKGSMHNPGGGAVSLHNRVKESGGLVTGAAPNRMPQSVRAGNKTLVPYRVALALQEAGWVVRQDVIWRKPSPMPESIDGWRWERCRVRVSTRSRDDRLKVGALGQTPVHSLGSPGGAAAQWAECLGCDKCRASDGYVLRKGSWRPTTAHEFVFQIVKSPEYFCDAAAAKEPVSQGSIDRFGKNPAIAKSSKANGQEGTNRAAANARMSTFLMDEGRNPRSVWTISSEAYKGKHFAAFPTMLAWKCIQASTSAGGCCAECGSQYAPVVEKGRVATRPGNDTKVDGVSEDTHGNRDPQRHIAVKRTLGYRATCGCNAGDPVPCVVADPFTGSGTVLQVATNTGRRFFGSEIAAHYLPLIQERAATPWVPKTEKRPSVKRRKKLKRERLLFG
jgi:DNA modification methylase